MIIRTLIGKSVEELKELGCTVNGIPCRSVTYNGAGSNSYSVYLGSGDILQAKGHDKFECLALPRQARSSDRIQPWVKW